MLPLDKSLRNQLERTVKEARTIAEAAAKAALDQLGVGEAKPYSHLTEEDRGKDVASAPWYYLFNGDRINDHHLTLAVKRAAMEAKST